MEVAMETVDGETHDLVWRGSAPKLEGGEESNNTITAPFKVHPSSISAFASVFPC